MQRYMSTIGIFLLTFFVSILLALTAYADLNLELPDLNLPNLGSNATTMFSSSSEREHGLAILRKLRGSGQLIEDPELNIWIRSLGNQLTASAPQASTPFYFVIARDDSVNAFATMGGVIVINAGLILRSDSESELAAVMAHEVAHITQRHIPRMIQQAKNNKFVTGAALLAGVIASTKDVNAGQAIIHATMATTAHRQLAFSRDAESEADRVGLRILARAGFNPQGMPSFLAKLEAFSDGKSANAYEFLRNHPLTLKRVSDTSARAKRIPFRAMKHRSSYLHMKEKIRALSRSTQPIPAKIPAKVKKYANSLQLAQRNNDRAALKTIGTHSSSIPEAILIAQLLNKQQHYKESIALLKPLLNIHLGNEALAASLARAYTGAGQSNEAWKVLNNIHISEQSSLEFFEIKQQIARFSRHNGAAYRAAAERLIRIGNYKSAISLLNQATKLPDTNATQVLQIQKLLSQLK